MHKLKQWLQSSFKNKCTSMSPIASVQIFLAYLLIHWYSFITSEFCAWLRLKSISYKTIEFNEENQFFCSQWWSTNMMLIYRGSRCMHSTHHPSDLSCFFWIIISSFIDILWLRKVWILSLKSTVTLYICKRAGKSPSGV